MLNTAVSYIVPCRLLSTSRTLLQPVVDSSKGGDPDHLFSPLPRPHQAASQFSTMTRVDHWRLVGLLSGTAYPPAGRNRKYIHYSNIYLWAQSYIYSFAYTYIDIYSEDVTISIKPVTIFVKGGALLWDTPATEADLLKWWQKGTAMVSRWIRNYFLYVLLKVHS